MSQRPPSSVRIAVRVHDLLLGIYPNSLRAGYRDEIRLAFRDLAEREAARHGSWGVIRLTARTIADAGRVAIAERSKSSLAIAERQSSLAIAERRKSTLARARETPSHRRRVIGGLTQDVGYALRSFRRTPGFTAAAVVTVALGIGASTSIFSFVDAVLLKPLPWPHAERIVAITKSHPEFGFAGMSISAEEWELFEQSELPFELASASMGWSTDVRFDEYPEPVEEALVRPGLLDLLGIEPLFGRSLAAADFRPGAAAVALIDYPLWRDRLGGDRNAIGKPLEIGGEPVTLVGVLPSSARFPRGRPRIIRPIALRATDGAPASGSSLFFVGLGRLSPHVSPSAAQARMQELLARFEAQHPNSWSGWQADLTPVRERIVSGAGRPLLVLFAAVMFVLLIACANVANLLLARGAARQRELSVRQALGAGRARLARQLLTENLVLAVSGGLVGIGLAAGCLEVLVALAPDTLPDLERVVLDHRVLAFAVGLSLASGLTFGLVPVLGASRRAGGRLGGGGMSATRLRFLLSVAEVALAAVLLVGVALLVQSLFRLLAVDPGFRPGEAVLAELTLPGHRFADRTSRLQLIDEVVTKVEALPGIERAGTTSWVPLTGSWGKAQVVGEHSVVDAEAELFTYQWQVTPGLLESMGIELLEGRHLTAADRSGSEKVAVVNREFVETMWPGESGVDQRFTFNRADDEDAEWIRIVGVAADVRPLELSDEPGMGIYVPLAQSGGDAENAFLVARSTVPPESLIASLRAAVHDVNGGILIGGERPLVQVLDQQLATPRFHLAVLAALGGVALALAVIGIYSVVAFGVAQRSREIGVRVALGASVGDVFRQVASQGVRMVAAGALVGVLLAAALTRLMASLLFEVEAHDPLSFFVVAAVLAVTGLIASVLPARRATRIEPMVALREE